MGWSKIFTNILEPKVENKLNLINIGTNGGLPLIQEEKRKKGLSFVESGTVLDN